MEQKTTSWLKKIFSISTLTAVATIVAACISVIEYVDRNGGKFLALINNEEANPPINNTILIYLDKDSADLSKLGFFPIITNPSNYSLQDFNLTYLITSSLADISYTDFFSIHKFTDGEQLTLNDKQLFPKTDIPSPFYHFFIKNNGQASIRIRATYSGVDTPFTYQAKVYAKKIVDSDYSKRHYAIKEDVKKIIAQNNLNAVDVFIIDSENNESFETLSLEKTDGDDLNNLDKYETKTIEQVEAKNIEILKWWKNNYKAPWYIYIIWIFLSAFGLFGFLLLLKYLGQLMEFMEGRTGGLKSIIGVIFSAFITYLCGHYSLWICHITSIPSFWLGLSSFFIIILAFVFAYLCLVITKKIFRIYSDSYNWIFWIYLLLLLYSASYLCYILLNG